MKSVAVKSVAVLICLLACAISAIVRHRPDRPALSAFVGSASVGGTLPNQVGFPISHK